MPDDVTPSAAAPADAAGQPAPQAVPAPDSPAAAPASPATTAAPAPKLWANKFQSPEVLEESYTHLQAEASRMAQQLADQRRAAPATPEPQTYTPEQLESSKVSIMQKQAKAIQSGDDEKVAEYAGNLVWIDQQLRKVEQDRRSAAETARTAAVEFATEADQLLQPYQQELQPGTAVYALANRFYQQAVMAGAPANKPTAQSASLLALVKSGKLKAGDAMQASQDATKQLNQALKSAAAAGSGAANTNAAPAPDFSKMDPTTVEGRQAFAAHRRSLGVGT